MSSIHRFFQPDAAQSAAPAITGREAHHAFDVLRLRAGDALTLLDGAGHRFVCVVKTAARNRVELAVEEKYFTPAPPCPVTLLAAIPKGKIEAIIEKATELGASRIVPLLTERTVVKIGAEDATAKVEKWRQVAVESIKQCGSPWLPRIEVPLTPAQFVARGGKFDLSLVASLQPGAVRARELFVKFLATHGRAPESACVWVGPEGDFTAAEYAAIAAAGAAAFTLGALVLRADTAATACLAVLNEELAAVQPR